MRIPPADFRLRKLLYSRRDKLARAHEHNAEGRVSRRRRIGDSYDAALTVSARRIRELQAFYERERLEARELIAELLRHPTERQLVLLRNYRRFHTWGVFENLLDLCFQEIILNPQAGEERAKLALDLSNHLDTERYGAEPIEDMRARAWAYIGNARRVRFELREAEEAFDRAHSHLRNGTHEPWELAVWMDLKASLLRAQTRFGEAMRLLKRALVLFLAVGDRHRAGRTLVNMDVVLQRKGQPEQGIPLLFQALKLLDPSQEPRIVLIAKHNLADDLADAGRYMEAQRLQTQARVLYERFDEPWIRNRRVWVEAKIAFGLGQLTKAEELLVEARAGFLNQSAPYEVALVCLELAGIFAKQGRIAELKQLAQEMTPIFSSRKIHREALAALAFWRHSVEAETASAELAARVAAAVKLGRFDRNAPAQEAR